MLFSLSAASMSGRERRSRLICLAGVTAPLAGALLYNHGFQIPWLVCPLRSLTGIPCPTCGITRSLMAMADGNWAGAIGYHALGLPLFLGLLLAALHLLLELGLQRRVNAFYGRWLRSRRGQIGFGVVLLLYYAVRLRGWAASGELLTAMRASAVGHFF